VDHDETHCNALADLIRGARLEVSVATTGASALAELEKSGADVILFDPLLPDASGTEVYEHLRRRSDASIIIVTAEASEIDRVVGLEAGADDYVAKPYSPRELMARIRAILRRRRWRSVDVERPAPVLVAGPVQVDLERHVVTVSDRVVRLPLREFELLELLLRNAGRVLTRSQIIERVWGASYVGDTKTLDTHVRRLRGRLEPVPTAPRHLVTVRGLGFRFQP
jgi:two-component system response regulator RegX3